MAGGTKSLQITRGGSFSCEEIIGATAQVEMLVGADSFLRDLEDCYDQFVHFVCTWNDSNESSDCDIKTWSFG